MKKLFATLLMLVGLTSIVSAEENMIDGVNIVGTWAVFNEGGVLPCNRSADVINYLYEVKPNGTLVVKYNTRSCDCSRRLTNGVVDCQPAHYASGDTFTWYCFDGKLYVMDVPVAIEKVSDNELKATEGDDTYLLTRVTSFTPSAE
jgi:hypothetical protein